MINVDPIIKYLSSLDWSAAPIKIIVTKAEGLVEMIDEMPIHVMSRRLEIDKDVVSQLIEEIQYDMGQITKYPRWKDATSYRYALFSIEERSSDRMILARYSKHISTK